MEHEGLELAGVFEIAQEFGVARTTVSMWRSRPSGFPEPVAILAAGPVYDMAMVRKWHRERYSPSEEQSQ